MHTNRCVVLAATDVWLSTKRGDEHFSLREFSISVEVWWSVENDGFVLSGASPLAASKNWHGSVDLSSSDGSLIAAIHDVCKASATSSAWTTATTCK